MTQTDLAAEISRADLLAEVEAAPLSGLLTEDHVAALFNCSAAKLQRDRWRRTGLPFCRNGRHVRYRKADVLTYIARLPTTPGSVDVAA